MQKNLKLQTIESITIVTENQIEHIRAGLEVDLEATSMMPPLSSPPEGDAAATAKTYPTHPRMQDLSQEESVSVLFCFLRDCI